MLILSVFFVFVLNCAEEEQAHFHLEPSGFVTVSGLHDGQSYAFDWCAGNHVIGVTSGADKSRMSSLDAVFKEKLLQGVLGCPGAAFLSPFYCCVLDQIFPDIVMVALSYSDSHSNISCVDPLQLKIAKKSYVQDAEKAVTRIWIVVPQDHPLEECAVCVRPKNSDIALYGMPALKLSCARNTIDKRSFYAQKYVVEDIPLTPVYRGLEQHNVTIVLWSDGCEKRAIWDTRMVMLSDEDGELLSVKEYLTKAMANQRLVNQRILTDFFRALAFDLSRKKHILCVARHPVIQEEHVRFFVDNANIEWSLVPRISQCIKRKKSVMITSPHANRSIRGCECHQIVSVDRRDYTKEDLCADEALVKVPSLP